MKKIAFVGTDTIDHAYNLRVMFSGLGTNSVTNMSSCIIAKLAENCNKLRLGLRT